MPALIFVAFVVAYQNVIENHMLVPLVYARTVELDSLGVLIAVHRSRTGRHHRRSPWRADGRARKGGRQRDPPLASRAGRDASARAGIRARAGRPAPSSSAGVNCVRVHASSALTWRPLAIAAGVPSMDRGPMIVPVPLAKDESLGARHASALGSLLLGECFLIVGLLLLLFAPRPGVFLLLAGVSARIGSHLLLGILGYRQTMRRPWPHVRPLVEDDW
jgi:hypothetical protein